MTPREKAVELVHKFAMENKYYERAKQCALIHVDEILENFGTLTEGKQHYAAHCTIQFYEQVKQEIEKL
jgi:hypothetical protein